MAQLCSSTRISNVAMRLYFDTKGRQFFFEVQFMFVCLVKTMKNAFNFALAQDPLDMVRQSLSYNVHNNDIFSIFLSKNENVKKNNKVNVNRKHFSGFGFVR